MRNWRTMFEAIGVTAVVLSLLFVGLELEETRQMNMAELQYKRLALFHSEMLATLESEPHLEYMNETLYSQINGVNWNPSEFSPTQRASALIAAEARLAALDIEYRFIEHGFSVKSLDELEAEAVQLVKMRPELREVWPIWHVPGYQDVGFYGFMENVLRKSGTPE